jgi:uncharacterized HAD superfamily protein
MGKRFEKLIYTTLLLLFISAAASAQPYRKLTTDDFRGTANPGNTDEVAITNCTIEYSFTARPENDYYILSFNIKLIMNADQSWMDWRRITTPALRAEILKHEQGHYNISYLEQQELLRTVSHTVFRANYKQVANAIFDRINAKYKQLNLDYDADTQNSMNQVQQHSWDAYFARTLTALLGKGNYYAAATNNDDAMADNR